MKYTRRSFLRQSAAVLGAAMLNPRLPRVQSAPAWPSDGKMGRVTQGRVDIRTRPYETAAVTKSIYDDAVVPWLREVVGAAPGGYGSARWVETPEGYIYAPRLQPVWNKPNAVLTALPVTPSGKGMWAEVSVPYTEIIMRRAASSMWLREKLDAGQPIRLYHNMVVWVDDLELQPDGSTLYRVNERYGNPGDLFWVDATALRPLTEDDLAPIHPDAAEKKAVVNLTRQTMICYEGKREVYFCRISSGAKFDADGNAVDAWATPLGPHPIYRKLVSLHMSGEKTGDWPAVAWTIIFATGGVAVHSTYWHNAFGIPRSHGCVNCAPADAQWIWRWSYPHVGAEPGDIDVSGEWPPVGTIIEVTE